MALDDATINELSRSLKTFNEAQRQPLWKQVSLIVLSSILGGAVVAGGAYLGDRDRLRSAVQKNDEQDRILAEHDRRIGAAQTTADVAQSKMDKVMADHIDRHHMQRVRP